jgi:hypothetical protein
LHKYSEKVILITFPLCTACVNSWRMRASASLVKHNMRDYFSGRRDLGCDNLFLLSCADWFLGIKGFISSSLGTSQSASRYTWHFVSSNLFWVIVLMVARFFTNFTWLW